MTASATRTTASSTATGTARPGVAERGEPLGVRAVRAPVLCEQHAPDGDDARGAAERFP